MIVTGRSPSRRPSCQNTSIAAPWTSGPVPGGRVRVTLHEDQHVQHVPAELGNDVADHGRDGLILDLFQQLFRPAALPGTAPQFACGSRGTGPTSPRFHAAGTNQQHTHAPLAQLRQPDRVPATSFFERPGTGLGDAATDHPALRSASSSSQDSSSSPSRSPPSRTRPQPLRQVSQSHSSSSGRGPRLRTCQPCSSSTNLSTCSTSTQAVKHSLTGVSRATTRATGSASSSSPARLHQAPPPRPEAQSPAGSPRSRRGSKAESRFLRPRCGGLENRPPGSDSFDGSGTSRHDKSGRTTSPFSHTRNSPPGTPRTIRKPRHVGSAPPEQG